MGKLNNTKDRILQEASVLLGEKGYELVSMREISNAVGIKVSSLYNHYKSKQDILDNIIQHFDEKLDQYLSKTDDVEKLLETKTPEEILRKFIYIFDEDESPMMRSMLRLLYMEQYHNEAIRDLLFKYMIYNPANNLTKVLDKLIELKQIPPCNTTVISNMLIKTIATNAMMYTHDIDTKQADLEFYSYWEFFINFVLNKDTESTSHNEENEKRNVI